MNTEATKQKLEATGRTVAGWARSKGFDPERVRNVFRGRFKPRDEEIEALKEDGLLVVEEKNVKQRGKHVA